MSGRGLLAHALGRTLVRGTLIVGAVLPAAACTLTTRADDYFDPSERTTLLAAFDDGVPENLVAAEDAIFFSVGKRLYRVTKSGASIGSFVDLSGPPRSLSTGRSGALLVCDRVAGPLLFATAPPNLPIALSTSGTTGCLAAAISNERLLVVPEQAFPVDADVGVSLSCLIGDGPAPLVATTLPFKVTADDVAIGAAVNEKILALALRGNVGASDPAASFDTRPNAANRIQTCQLAKIDQPVSYPAKLVSPPGRKVFIARGGRDSLRYVPPGTACCGPTNPLPACGSATTLPKAEGARDFTATARFLYWTSEAAVNRRSLDALSDDTRDERWPLADGTSIAVAADDAFAFVAQGTRLVRIALR